LVLLHKKWGEKEKKNILSWSQHIKKSKTMYRDGQGSYNNIRYVMYGFIVTKAHTKIKINSSSLFSFGIFLFK